MRHTLAVIITLLAAAVFGALRPATDTRLPLILAPRSRRDNLLATSTATVTTTPVVTTTVTSTATSTSTPTATNTSAPTPSQTPVPTATSTSWIATAAPTVTLTPTGTATSTPTATGTAPPTSSPTSTGTPTSTPTQTSTATATSTSTSTPTVTPTPSPTATTFVGTIDVQNNHASFVDAIDALHIIGEIQNNTGANARFVKIIANLFNAQNQLVDTEFTYTLLDIVPVGETACFNIVFLDNPSFAYYTFETSYSETTDAPLPISIFGDNGSYDATFEDWYDVVGIARNDSSVNAEFVEVVGTLYRSNGEVLDCNFTFTNAEVLTPGQQSTWKITFLHAPAGTVGYYRLQAQDQAE